MRPSTLVACALVVATLTLGGPSAQAHENQAVTDGMHVLPPRGTVEFTERIHYHRLVGVVDAEGPASGTEVLRVDVVGPAATTTLAHGALPLRVNGLVPCCDDATWSPHTVRLVNEGDQELTVDARLSFLHDGLVLAAMDAEPGAAVSMLLFAAVPTGIALARLRRGSPGTPAAALRAGGAAVAGLWLLAAALALPSMIAYRGGPAAGVVAASAHLPWVGNAFLMTGDLLILALLGLWILALASWSAAARRASADRRVLGLGLLLALGALASSIAWAIDYDSWPVPLAAGALAAGAPLAWLAGPRRRASRGERARAG